MPPAIAPAWRPRLR